LAAYYPRKSSTIQDVLKEFERFGLVGFDEQEEQRLEDVSRAKMRGKGAPKKKRTAAGTDSYSTLDDLHDASNIYNRRESRKEGCWQEIVPTEKRKSMYIMIPSISAAEFIYTIIHKLFSIHQTVIMTPAHAVLLGVTEHAIKVVSYGVDEMVYGVGRPDSTCCGQLLMVSCEDCETQHMSIRPTRSWTRTPTTPDLRKEARIDTSIRPSISGRPFESN